MNGWARIKDVLGDAAKSNASPIMTLCKKVTGSHVLFLLTWNNLDNRFNKHSVAGIHQCLDQVQKEVLSLPKIQQRSCILLTRGTGKFYSNGLDLQQILKISDPSTLSEKEFVRMKVLLDKFVEETFLPLLSRMLLFPIPTIALINGHAFAGGLLFALSHDYKIMNSKSGFLCMNELAIGIAIHPGMMAIIASKMPSHKLTRCLLQCSRWNANQAVQEKIIDLASGNGDCDLLEDAETFVKNNSLNFAGKTYGKMKKVMYDDVVAKLAFKASKL